jgi:hypothetical protein
MTPVERIEQARARIARRYDTWLAELNDLRERHLNGLGYVGEEGVFEALQDTIDFTTLELREIANAAFDDATRMGSEASAEVEMPALVSMREQMEAAIDSGIARDVAQLRQGMSTDSIRFRQLSPRYGASISKAMIRGAVFGMSVFRQLDAAGRRMKSSPFVTTAVRWSIYSAYLHAFLSGALEIGSVTCTASHPEREDMVISIPDFDTWAEEFVHPNALWQFQLGVQA